MIWRRPLLLCLQPAQVTAGQRGQASSRPLPNAFRLDTIIAETDTPSGLVYVRYGISPGEVSSQAAAASGQSFVDSWGSLILTTNRDAIPLPQGTSYLSGLGIIVPTSLMRIWCEVINNQASDATRVSVTFQGEYIDEGASELQSAVEFPTTTVAAASGAGGGFKPATPVTP